MFQVKGYRVVSSTVDLSVNDVLRKRDGVVDDSVDLRTGGESHA